MKGWPFVRNEPLHQKSSSAGKEGELVDVPPAKSKTLSTSESAEGEDSRQRGFRVKIWVPYYVGAMSYTSTDGPRFSEDHLQTGRSSSLARRGEKRKKPRGVPVGGGCSFRKLTIKCGGK